MMYPINLKLTRQFQPSMHLNSRLIEHFATIFVTAIKHYSTLLISFQTVSNDQSTNVETPTALNNDFASLGTPLKIHHPRSYLATHLVKAEAIDFHHSYRQGASTLN